MNKLSYLKIKDRNATARERADHAIFARSLALAFLTLIYAVKVRVTPSGVIELNR